MRSCSIKQVALQIEIRQHSSIRIKMSYIFQYLWKTSAIKVNSCMKAWFCEQGVTCTCLYFFEKRLTDQPQIPNVHFYNSI
jgi:hypothetical protein